MIADNLIEARAQAGNPSFKAIALKAHCSALTVSRIFNRKNEYPDTFTLKNIAEALDTTLEKILAGAEASVGNVAPLEEAISSLKSEVEQLKAEVTLLRTEIAHKDEVIALKDEIISIYRSHSVTSI
jgi:transcriptional regulator with XRE-family HTH domain